MLLSWYFVFFYACILSHFLWEKPSRLKKTNFRQINAKFNGDGGLDITPECNRECEVDIIYFIFKKKKFYLLIFINTLETSFRRLTGVAMHALKSCSGKWTDQSGRRPGWASISNQGRAKSFAVSHFTMLSRSLWPAKEHCEMRDRENLGWIFW